MGTRTLWPENPEFLDRGNVGRHSPVAQNLLQEFLSYAQRRCVALQPPFPSVPWLGGAVCAGKISEQPNGLNSILLSFPSVLLFLDKGCWWGPLSHRSLPSGKPFGLSEALLKPGLAISHGRGSALSCDRRAELSLEVHGFRQDAEGSRGEQEKYRLPLVVVLCAGGPGSYKRRPCPSQS